MRYFKHGSILIAGAAAFFFSEAMEISPAHAACPITDFSIDGIETALKDPVNCITSAASFVKCLPPEFKENWIMMTYSQSAQSGTAKYPRFILSSKDSTKVFGFELPTNPIAKARNSFNTVEYMEFVGNIFRFHSIRTASQSVNPNDPECKNCHSAQTATQGPFRSPRPNWDAYDSWGGMLPFNRDRVYEKATVNRVDDEQPLESKAIKRIFRDLKKEGDALFAQLSLPKG